MKYECPTCGKIYIKEANNMLLREENGPDYCSFLDPEESQFYCKPCLYNFLANVYAGFKLRKAKSTRHEKTTKR